MAHMAVINTGEEEVADRKQNIVACQWCLPSKNTVLFFG